MFRIDIILSLVAAMMLLRFVCETLLPGRCHDAVVYHCPQAVLDEQDDIAVKQDQVLLIFRDGQVRRDVGMK